MAELVAVVDANVLLHYRPLEELGLPDVLGEAEVVVLFGDLVVRELDEVKNSGPTRVQDRARRHLKTIHAWATSQTDRRLGAQLRVEIDLDRITELNLVGDGLDPAVRDDSYVALALRHQRGGRNVCLLSGDTGARLTAWRFGIAAPELPDSARLATPRSELENEVVRLKHELLRLESRSPILKLGLRGGGDHLRVSTRQPHPRRSPEEIDGIVTEVTEQALAKLKSRQRNRDPRADSMAKALTQIDVDRYEKELDAYAERLAGFLRAEDLQLERNASAYKIEFELANTGSAPATGVDVYLQFPGGFQVTEPSQFHARPSHPGPPPSPSSMVDDIIRSISVPRGFRGPFPESPTIAALDPRSPRIRRANSLEVHYGPLDLKHHEDVSLGALLVAFSDVESVNSFGIEYRITANETLEPVEGALHFAVSEPSR